MMPLQGVLEVVDREGSSPGASSARLETYAGAR